MRKLIILALAVLIISGCAEEVEEIEEQPAPPVDLGEADCITDADCMTGGCSGEICQPKAEPPVVSICMYQEEFECVKLTSCRCIDGICMWENNSEYLECMAEKG